ncbi:MAG: Asp-tRNA(Asn)/Glu-tRNA(Gln) amidotransferase subunit GatB [Minisyncoccia bacterium]
MEYKVTIGLEIHAELKTKTKMFCSCLNDSLETVPNKNICPICLGHPGVLPAINKEAVRKVILVGLALNSKINKHSKFDRKNYFYPDLPKGYQISQYDEPLCKGGELLLYLSDDPQLSSKKIKIRRIHLEEDTGKLVHPEDKNSTLIDFNRAGVPLMELVTEPVIESSIEAKLFCQGLQLLLKKLEVSEADMEKGQMRCEVNISLAEISQSELGTKVEIKNLNSFRAVEKAIEYEIKRQKEILEKGEKVIQETRGWDAIQEITYSQRTKEEAQDYRYFPEPDLPPLNVYELFNLEKLKEGLPQLPWEKKEKLIKNFNLSLKETNIFLTNEELFDFFEKTIKELQKEKADFNKALILTKNYLLTDILGILEKEQLKLENIKLNPLSFKKIIFYLLEEKISSRVAKDILLEIIQNGGDPEEIIKAKGLIKISDKETILPFIKEIIKNNPQAISDYKKGKENVLQFLVGQVMAKLKGAADPKVIAELLKDEIAKI